MQSEYELYKTFVEDTFVCKSEESNIVVTMEHGWVSPNWQDRGARATLVSIYILTDEAIRLIKLRYI